MYVERATLIESSQIIIAAVEPRKIVRFGWIRDDKARESATGFSDEAVFRSVLPFRFEDGLVFRCIVTGLFQR